MFSNVEMDDQEALVQFAQSCNQLGSGLTDETCMAIKSYCDGLKSYNENVNLVSNSNLRVVLRDHVLDSFALNMIIDEEKTRLGRDELSLVDIGSGAGFPGMILALARPDFKVVLIESIAKKCVFLMQSVAELKLENRVTVLHERAESVAHRSDYREKFDFATARAVGNLNLVAELAMPFLRHGGCLLAQRSRRQLDEEMPGAQKLFSRFAGNVGRCIFPDEKIMEKQVGILLVEKKGTISGAFPRSGAKLGT